MTVYQLTKRRWADILVMPRFYLMFGSFFLVGSIIGPFGTFDALTLSQRVGFSLIANTVCWTIGVIITVPARLTLERWGFSKNASILVACSFANILIFPAFVLMLEAELGKSIPFAQTMEGLAIVWFIVTFLAFNFLSDRNPNETANHENRFHPLEVVSSEMMPSQSVRNKQQLDTSKPLPCHAEPSRCVLQLKLPREKRGPIYALIAQDHYVEVVTAKGTELILMRLADAIGTCDPQDSLRIHRSVWVTKQGVQKLKKTGRSMQLVLHNGREVPVSRPSEKAARAMFGTPSRSTRFEAVPTTG